MRKKWEPWLSPRYTQFRVTNVRSTTRGNCTIDRVKSGESRVKVSTDVGLTESTLRTWLSNGAKLRTFLVDIDSDEGLSRKCRCLGQDTDLDAAVYTWFVLARQNGITISGPIIKAQAEKFHKELGSDTEFKASDGWLYRFQKQHAISEATISGEFRNGDHDELRTVIANGGCNEVYSVDKKWTNGPVLRSPACGIPGIVGQKDQSYVPS